MAKEAFGVEGEGPEPDLLPGFLSEGRLTLSSCPFIAVNGLSPLFAVLGPRQRVPVWRLALWKG
eukprot:4128565-Alexandrium_andersonii.AAC.1